MKLSIRPYPHAEESIEGYKLRLAVANGWDSYPKLARASEFPAQDDILDELTGHGKRLDDLGLSAERSAIQARDIARVYQSLKLAHVRICPTCLSEGRPHQAEWQFLPFTRCSIHHSDLLHSCPSCHSPIQLVSGVLENFCSCGHRYEVESKHAQGQEAWLTHFLSVEHSRRGAFLRDMTLAMQRAARPFDSVVSQRRIPPRDQKTWTGIVSRAYGLLTNEQEAINWIGNCYEARAELAGLGVKAQMQPVSSFVDRLELEWPVKAAFSNHKTYRDIAYTLHSMRLPDDPSRYAKGVNPEEPDKLCQRQVDMKDYADILGIDPTSVTALFEQGVLVAQRPARQIRYAYFDLAETARFVDALPKARMGRYYRPISEFAEVLPLFAASWSDLIGPVMRRKLESISLGPDKNVISSVAVDSRVATTVLYHRFRRRAWDHLDNLTQDEARKVLCIPRGDFKQLATSDILSPMPWHTTSDRYRVKDVANALLRYVFIKRWSVMNGVPTDAVIKLVSSRGFEPVCHTAFTKSRDLVMALNSLKREFRKDA